MSYNDEALKAKLSTLSETQDSIVSVSQWISFHKRHADRIASYWLTRLRDAPPPKRLNYVYLVNDIVQNARARKRPEFPDAFSPLMPEALATAYRSSTPEIQNKIRRVTEVWRTRSVFETPIQSAIEARLDEIDKSKSTSGKKTLGGSLFSSSPSSTGGGSVPSEMATLPPLQIAVTKASLTSNPASITAQSEYAKLNGPDAVLPSPPVHAARLSSLMKSLATAESSVSASIKARQSLITDLARILDVNKEALVKDEATLSDLSAKRTETEAKKRDVEDAIMRGLAASSEEGSGLNAEDSGNGDGYRPEVEELTPEPDDVGFTTTPPANYTQEEYVPSSGAAASTSSNPQLRGLLAGFGNSSSDGDLNVNINAAEDTLATSMAPTPPTQGMSPASPSRPLISSATTTSSASRVRQASSELPAHTNGYNTAKRRKTSHGDAQQAFVPDLGGMGMDEDEFAIPPPQHHQHSPGGNRYGQHGVAGIGEFSPPPPISQSHEDNDMLGNLDADVDELIRRGGSGI